MDAIAIFFRLRQCTCVFDPKRFCDERDVVQDQQMEDRILKRQDTQDARFRIIERMCWVALGGLGVVGTMVTIYGHNIMKVLVGS